MKLISNDIGWRHMFQCNQSQKRVRNFQNELSDMKNCPSWFLNLNFEENELKIARSCSDSFSIHSFPSSYRSIWETITFRSYLYVVTQKADLLRLDYSAERKEMTLTVWKWGNPQCFHLPPGFWPMGGLGIAPIPHLTITSPLVNRLCSSRWNYRRCQSPHKGCRLAPASKLIIREKPRLSPK